MTKEIAVLQSSIVNRKSSILYIEPFSGISGDMLVGALIDLGLDLEDLRQKLSLLPVQGYRLSARKTSKNGIQATKFDVLCEEDHHTNTKAHSHQHERTFRQIRELILSSSLSPWVKEKSSEAFRKLAEAEGKIHGQNADDVHFHEVGAVDSIVDIVGSMIGLEQFLPATFLSAAVNLGQGTVECRHGRYPVPGPATQELLKGAPTYSDSAVGELTTPTGAALLATLVERFAPRPLMRIVSTGYGAGSRDLPGTANVLRVTVGEETEYLQPSVAGSQVAVLEATIDDMSPQLYGYFQEKALAEGALDVYATSIQMKKNRPALKTTVLCAPEDIQRMARLMFGETTTIGIRYTIAQRITLQREFIRVQTEYGEVTVKVSTLEGKGRNFLPEYEDCRRLAKETGVALKDIQAAAVQAYLRLISA
jgi:uncharacterized protein (TIGR00299 family) protein